MAIAYLNEGSTTLAAASWSDATGFAAGATLVINGGTQVISGGLSQTGSSIESLDILGFGGVIGGASGALECDVDGTSESATSVVSRLRFWSPGTIFFKANGGNALCHFFQLGGGGNAYLTGGAFKNLHMESGRLSVADTVTSAATWYLSGGSASIDYHASNALTTLAISGGAHDIRKQCTTITMYGGSATVDCQGLSITNINLFGGTLRLLSCGGVTNFTGLGGVLDNSGAKRAVSFGSSSCVVGPNLMVKPSPLVTLGTRTVIGSGPAGVV